MRCRAAGKSSVGWGLLPDVRLSSLHYSQRVTKPDFILRFLNTLKLHASDWDEISLTEVPSTLQDTTELIHQIKAAGLFVEIIQESVSFRFQLPATWQEYLAEISAEFRGTLESTARKIAKMPDIQLVDLAATDRWQAGLEALYDMHQQRWISKGENGVFANKSTRRMHLEIVDHLRKKG